MFRLFPGQIFEIRDPAVKDFWIKQQKYQTSIIRVYVPDEINEVSSYVDFVTAVASFGPELTGELPIGTLVQVPSSPYGCSDYNTEEAKIINGHVLFVKRGACTFVEKVLKAQQAGAKSVVVWNNENYLFQPASPSEKNMWKFDIPCVFHHTCLRKF